jgi:hypothetical protein
MVSKIIQWVPIDGTRWRNEFVNGHEIQGMGVHYGVAPGGLIGFIPRGRWGTLIPLGRSWTGGPDGMSQIELAWPSIRGRWRRRKPLR